MLRVGLTGGIGSGKSEVSRRLATRGAVVIDADVLSREVLAAGGDGFDEVVAAFGRDVVGDDGEIDRPALANAVFADDSARRRLESIVHPRVRARAAELESEAADADPGAVVVHDIALLVETGQAADFDEVVVVDAPDDLRVQRLVRSRGMNPDQARARMQAQASRSARLDAANEVVDNSGDLTALDVQVDALWQRLGAAAQRS